MKVYGIAITNKKNGEITLYSGNPSGIRLFASPADAAKLVREVFGAPTSQCDLEFAVVEMGTLLPAMVE